MKRALKVLLFFMGFIAIGLGYAIWCQASSIHIPCLFHLVTGWYCPGCGVTRMCLALLELDFKAAFYYNKAIVILLPFYCFLGISYTIRYIKSGYIKAAKWENIGMIISIIILVIYGFVRNILPCAYF